MRLHIDLEAADIARTTGMSPAEARRQALAAFGGVSHHKDAHLDARGGRWLAEVGQDVLYAVRSLRRSPGFTLSSVVVLALGIGSTTAVFSAVKVVLLNPAYDNLGVMYLRQFPSLSTVDFRAIEEQQRSFSAVGAIRIREVAFSAGGDAQQMRVGAVTSGFFRALGVRPVRGRVIAPSDEPVGTPPVVVVSHALAERALGGETGAIGKSIMLDDVAHTVIGVLPRGLREPGGMRGEAWAVLQLEQPTRRGPFGMLVIARLAPGVTFAAATRDVSDISDRIFPLWSSGRPQDGTGRFSFRPYRETFLVNASRMLRVFAAGVGLVLLIAVANVASLMLVRAVGRTREVSLRTVLGASRARLVRLFVTESVVLAGFGAIAGVAIGALSLRALIVLGPRMPGLDGTRLDVEAVGFAAAVAVLAGLIVGAYPVALLLKGDRSSGLQGGDRTVGAGRGTQAVRSAFVVSQFALALPVLAVAGLLFTSFVNLQRVNPGFDPQHLLTVRISLPSGRYANDTVIAAYWTRALPRVREVVGVREAGFGSVMPPNVNGNSDSNFNLLDRPVPVGTAEPNSPAPSVSAGYFAALGVRLLEGRMFQPSDTAGATPVAIVSRSWAQHYYPGTSPIGRRLIRGGCTECEPTVIVGVVGDVQYGGPASPPHALYAPSTERWPRVAHLFVRTAGLSAQITERVRAALRSVDPGIPLEDVASMEERLSVTNAQPRQWATLLGAFASVALVLAAVGIFGMLSYAVSTRRREIGVRMALGAKQRTVVGMIVKRGLSHAAVGTVLGLVAALVGTRSVGTVLFGVTATDPTTLATVTAALFAVALVAVLAPGAACGSY